MLLLSLAGTACLASDLASWYEPMLPESVEGWTAGRVRVCGPNDLFAYMDGAGELYLAYSFRDLAVCEYTKPREPKVTVEIYRMVNPQDAYGVLSVNRSLREKDRLGRGPDRDYGAGLFQLRRGRYYLRALAEKESRGTKKLDEALSKTLTEAVQGESVYPDLMEQLPTDGFIKRSDRFFHKSSVLNYIYYVSDENILDLGEKTDAIFADYKVGRGVVHVMLVRYPTESDATMAFNHFCRAYFRDKPASSVSPRIERVERSRFAGIAREGRTLRLVFEAASEEECRKMLSGETKG